MFSTRKLEENDYDTLLKWWKWWRFPAPTREMLPENGIGGFMVEKDGIEICAGFLYLTNSKMCWIEFIVSNPQYRENDRKEAIEALIIDLGIIAREMGYSIGFTSIKSVPLIKTFEKAGFTIGSTNTTEMVKIL